MTTISRRALTLGLGATVLLPRVGSASTPTADDGLPGHIVTNRLDPDTLDDLSGLVVVDLATGTVSEIDMPTVWVLHPHRGTSLGIAWIDGGAYLVDAADLTATVIEPHPVGKVIADEPFADVPLAPVPAEMASRSSRFAVFMDPAFPRWLIDLERSTVVDLIATYAAEDRLFQLAALTNGGTLVVGSGDQLLSIDPETLEASTIVGPVTAFERLTNFRLSPGGTTVAFAQMGENGSTTIRTASIDSPAGSSDPAIMDEVGGLGFLLSFAWAGDDAFVVATRDGMDTRLERVNRATGLSTAIGSVADHAIGPYVLGSGSHLLTAGDTADGLAWHLTDIGAGTTLVVEDLTGYTTYGPLSTDVRAVVFVPADFTGIGTAGMSFLVLDTATGEVRPLVELVDGQAYSPPYMAPGGRSAVIGEDGPGGEALLFCNLNQAKVVHLADYEDRTFSPDGRYLLTRGPGDGARLEIWTAEGEKVRELDLLSSRAWWLG